MSNDIEREQEDRDAREFLESINKNGGIWKYICDRSFFEALKTVSGMVKQGRSSNKNSQLTGVQSKYSSIDDIRETIEHEYF